MQGDQSRLICFNGFTLDLPRGCLRRGDGEIRLRPKLFDVLRYLVQNRGRLISKDELIGAVWPNAFVTDNSLVQCMIEIRRALDDDGQTMIRTVPRRGYILDGQVDVPPAQEAVTTAVEADRPSGQRLPEVPNHPGSGARGSWIPS